MATTLNLGEITLRLVCALATGILFGLNRGEHGRPAGLRTTTLVCLAACLAMLQANWLLNTTGKGQDSFVTLDLMRLPLGILSGMGFIGGGAILRRDNMVLGVTTAATLWMVTILGLCFGGGQIFLGATGAALGFLVLWGLNVVEQELREDHRARLVLVADAENPVFDELPRYCARAAIRIAGQSALFSEQGSQAELHFELRWRGRRRQIAPPSFLPAMAKRPGVHTVQWTPIGFMGL